MGEGEGVMICANSIETCTSPHVKQIASPGSMHETGRQGWCTGMTQRDGIGEGDGREFRMGTHVHLWLIHVSVWQRPPQYCKVIQFSSVAQSCPTRCDPMNRSTPGLPVHHQLSESTQTHIHRVSDVIQPSHPLSPPSPPALNLSQHQGLFK